MVNKLDENYVTQIYFLKVVIMNNTLSKSQQEMLAQFQAHVDAELRQDVEATLATMSANPHLYNVPTMEGAVGSAAVCEFYSRLLPGKFFASDTEMLPVSRTIGHDQIVDEIIFKFTHNSEVGWMLPNIAPTGKRVEIPLVVIFKVTNGKVEHEHIYWDQASVLVQIGLLDPKNLPIHGVETARNLEKLIGTQR